MGKEAVLYEKLPNNKVRCTACARYCEMAEGQVGLCGIRGNQNGKLDK
jgi:pyruvate formate lyase activating enzyme